MPFKDISKRRAYQRQKKREYRKRDALLRQELSKPNPDIKRMQEVITGRPRRKR